MIDAKRNFSASTPSPESSADIPTSATGSVGVADQLAQLARRTKPPAGGPRERHRDVVESLPLTAGLAFPPGKPRMNLEWVELTAELLARNVVTSEQIALVLNAPEVLAERLIEQARRRFEGTDTAEATATRQAPPAATQDELASANLLLSLAAIAPERRLTHLIAATRACRKNRRTRDTSTGPVHRPGALRVRRPPSWHDAEF